MDDRIELRGGLTVPRLGLGVFQVEPELTRDVVEAALRAGYRRIDTAALYANELQVAQGIDRSGVDPAEVVLASKVWNDDHGRERTLRAFDATLEKLGRDVLDLYLIHWPAPRHDLYVETWRTLVELRDSGRVRAIGVCNFTESHLDRILDEVGETPAINQIELHPLLTQAPMRERHEQLGIATEAWSPLGRGRVLEHPVLHRIAAECGKSPAQVVIRWHLQSGRLVIPRTTRVERLRENAAVEGWSLSVTQLAEIDALDVGQRVGSHPDDRH